MIALTQSVLAFRNVHLRERRTNQQEAKHHGEVGRKRGEDQTEARKPWSACHLSIISRRPEMNRLLTLALPALLVGATTTPAPAADVTEAELMQAATALAQQYDANYAAKDPAGMAALYASDGVLVAPSGSIVRGRQALTTYYANRFASGARSHAIKVVEAHVQGNGGYGLTQFTVTVPGANGNLREEHGSIVVVYRRDADGWHMRLVEPSVPESADQ
jgi:uncharacterized protein (TIGR02246 family)